MIYQIFIIYNNKTLVIKCDSNDKIEAIIRKIRKKTNITHTNIYLTYNSKHLLGNESISYYNIGNNSTLYLNFRFN